MLLITHLFDFTVHYETQVFQVVHNRFLDIAAITARNIDKILNPLDPPIVLINYTIIVHFLRHFQDGLILFETCLLVQIVILLYINLNYSIFVAFPISSLWSFRSSWLRAGSTADRLASLRGVRWISTLWSLMGAFAEIKLVYLYFEMTERVVRFIWLDLIFFC